MARVEFFKITIKDKKTDKELERFDFSRLLQDKLSNTSDAMKHCTHGVRSKCSASVGDYKKSEDNITFDLIKFQQEHIKSTLISEPKLEVDTYKVLHNISVDSATYTNENIKVVKDIIYGKSLNLFDIQLELQKLFKDINKFAIYKIIISEGLNKKEENNSLDKLFYDNYLKRLSTNKTFFNMWFYGKETNILLMEKNSSGFTYTDLEIYFNKHLLIDEKYKISIDYIYDKDFSYILYREKLHKFEFTITPHEQSLNEKEINQEFRKLFLKYFEKTKITIAVHPLDEKGSLENKQIITFFDLARNVGLIPSAKISKTDNKRKNIPSTSKGDILSYTVNIRSVNNLEEAHTLFQNAIKKNSKISI
jgi:hypothetical protein